MKTAPRPLNFVSLLLNAGLILAPAILYSIKTDSPVYPVISLVLLLWAFFRKDYLAYRDRPVIYSLTAVLILTILPDMMITINDSRYGLFDLLVRSNLLIPLLLYTAAVSTVFYPYPSRCGFTAACVIMALVICGDRFNSEKLSNTLLSFLDVPLRHYTLTYWCIAGAAVLLLPLYFIRHSRSDSEPHSFSIHLRPFLLAGLLIGLPLTAGLTLYYYYSNSQLLRTVEYFILRFGMRRPGWRGAYHLSTQANLNVPLPPQWLVKQDVVLLRLKSKQPPQYLRSKVYTHYEAGRWLPAKSEGQKIYLAATRRTHIESYSTFQMPGRAEKGGIRTDLYFAGLRNEGIIPVPGNLLYFDAVADEAEFTGEGILNIKHWRDDGGCTMYLSETESSEAWQYPADPMQNPELSEVPASLKETLVQVQYGKDDPIRNLKNYFASYRYTLENVNSSMQDPLIPFLTKTHAGHCEFFAAATVLLLRNAGIPARYVTGFLCFEHHPYSDYYVVRASHAHAWCEAWNASEKKWVIADSTPEGMLELLRTPKRSRRHFIGDWVKQITQQMFADVRRGHFAKAVIDILTQSFWLLWRCVRTIPGAIAVLLILVFCVWRIRCGIRRKKMALIRLSPQKMILQHCFCKFEKQYAKITGRHRDDSETIREFYRNTPFEEISRAYELLRYRTEDPADAEIADFQKIIASADLRSAALPDSECRGRNRRV